MGREKERLIKMQERGYGYSDKYVCASCFGDKYLGSVIRESGEIGYCSYCKYVNGRKKRKLVLPLDEIMPYLMDVINSDFFESECMLPWDSERKEYIGKNLDVWDLVHDELNQYMECENEALLNEIYDLLLIGDQVSRYDFEKRKEDIDFQSWKQFCELVRLQPLTPEQIIDAAFSKNASDELQEIRKILQMIGDYSRELKMDEMLNPGVSIYRCRKDLEVKKNLSEIKASDIGTAPAQFANTNRMSTKGDMMFYGAKSKKTAYFEIGAENGCMVTTGMFQTNKRIRVLNLHRLWNFKCPSIFDQAGRDRRSVWHFYKYFMQDVSKPIYAKSSDQRDYEYKPTQVFTKYVQKKLGMSGILYNSSHSRTSEDKYGVNGEECVVLFVDHENCINEGDKVNKNITQLILKECPTQEIVVS